MTKIVTLTQLKQSLSSLCRTSLLLITGLLLLRVFEFILLKHELTVAISIYGIANDIILFLRVFLIMAIPFIFLYRISEKIGTIFFSLVSGMLLIIQYILIRYFCVAHVLLGSDLYAYTIPEIKSSIQGANIGVISVLSSIIVAISCWFLAKIILKITVPQKLWWLSLLALLSIILPTTKMMPSGEFASMMATNKLSYFINSSWSYSMKAISRQFNSNTAPEGSSDQLTFMHNDKTPDALGGLFRRDTKKPPNIVIIQVEGLARAFSGPNAYLGSFTPFLDSLGQRSVNFNNFLATQGRTFAILPSLLASLPFGENGFSELGDRMPSHFSLMNILRRNGYHTAFYCGVDTSFDNQGMFLKKTGVDTIIGKNDFTLARTNDYWGYPDDLIFKQYMLLNAPPAVAETRPFVHYIETVTMHTPYTFPNKAKYQKMVEERMTLLGFTEKQKNNHRDYLDIYSSIMFTDDALRQFIDQYSRLPAYSNTIFVITGDHRLPEIPLRTKIDRYHVPMMIFSPLLTSNSGLQINSVSSHFDITPSLLAMLRGYGVKTPDIVAWVGKGLDMNISFRNINTAPLKQTKDLLNDFFYKDYFINQNTLFTLNDNMAIEPTTNPAMLQEITDAFSNFTIRNNHFIETLKLLPDGTVDSFLNNQGIATAAYVPATSIEPPEINSKDALRLSDIQFPASVVSGESFTIKVRLTNSAVTPSETVIPIAVLLDGKAVELREADGTNTVVDSSQSVTISFTISTDRTDTGERLKPGNYFIAVILKDESLTKNVGQGIYRQPITITPRK